MNFRQSRPDFESQHKTHQYARDLPHPRLFFSASDVVALRNRAQRIRGFLERLTAKTDSYIAQPDSLSDNLSVVMRETKVKLNELSSAYVLTGDQQYAEALRIVLEQAFAIEQWIYPVHQPTEFDHGSANMSAAVAVAIDWLDDFISPDERRNLKEQLVEKTMETFRRVYASRSEAWVHTNFNWRSMICSDMGLALLTVLEVYPNFMETMAYVLHGVLAVLDNAPQDGEWEEGVGYWGAAVGLPLRFIFALDRITEGTVNLFQHPYLNKTGDFLVHCIDPGGRVFNFADCGPVLRPRRYALVGLLGQKFNNPQWKKLALKGQPADLFDLAFTEGLTDPGSVPDPPLAKYFREGGIVTLRSGWEKNDVFIGFKSGPTAVGHSHLDINSFVVTAFNRTLISDLGVWPYGHYLGFFDLEERRWTFDANTTIGHNTLLVDGGGQRYGESHFGRILKFEPADRFDLVISDGTRVYGGLLSSYCRWLIFIRPDLLVIFDDITSDNLHSFQWALHVEGQADGKTCDLRVTNGPAGFNLNFLLPCRDKGWVAEERRRQVSYRNSNTGKMETKLNHYYAFSPIHRTTRQRFLATISLYPTKEREVLLWRTDLEQARENRIVLSAQRKDQKLQIYLFPEKLTAELV